MTHAPSLRASRRRESGSAVLAALLILAVTLIAVGDALFEASHRFRTSHHSSRWAQAGQAAEAGADIGMMTANKASWVADGWSGAPGSPGTSAVTKTVTLDSGVTNTGPISATISVDTVSISSAQWLRIRSTGTADASGGARAGIDKADVLLRKMDLRKNRNTGATLSAPQATRTVEVLAKPKSTFTMGLVSKGAINMSGGAVIDSFDSSNSAKSTNGQYDVTKRQSNGKVGVIDTQSASDLRSQYVYGSIAYSGAAIANTSNVTGGTSTPFSKTITNPSVPTWTTFNASPTSIATTMTLTGGTASSPALYKVSSVNLSGSNVLTLAPYAANQQSYVEIWVTGNFQTSGSSYILQQAGVHATYHIQGSLNISGGSFVNQTNLAANNTVEIIPPAGGGTQSAQISGSGSFVGTLNAPGADVNYSGSAHFSGAMIVKTLLMSGGASLHYDEALASGSGSGGSYTFGSLVEAVR
jgi:hypothetical protein